MPDGLAPGHPGEPHEEDVLGWGLLFPFIAKTGLQGLAKGLPAGAAAPAALSHIRVPLHAPTASTFAKLHCPHSSNIIHFFRGLLLSIIVLHPRHSPMYCCSTFVLSPCSLLVFLHCCPLCSSLPISVLFSSCLLSQRLGERSHSYLSLYPSSLVQRLSLNSGGESQYPPCWLPHEEVLLGLVSCGHGGKNYLMGEAEDCYWTQ